VECLDYVRGKILLGINTVVNLQTLPRLGEMAAIVKRLGAIDWLLLPEVRDGEFVFTDSEWKLLDKWITEVRSEIDVRVSTEAAEYLKCPVLIENQIEDYAHISADGYLRRCSYVRGGIALQGSTITTALRDLRNSA